MTAKTMLCGGDGCGDQDCGEAQQSESRRSETAARPSLREVALQSSEAKQRNGKPGSCRCCLDSRWWRFGSHGGSTFERNFKERSTENHSAQRVRLKEEICGSFEAYTSEQL